MEMAAPDFAKWLETNQDAIDLIDVREVQELQSGGIGGARHCPLSRFMELFPKFSRQKMIGVYCSHGIRSLDVAGFLRGQGFTAVSLEHGLEAWNGPLAAVAPLR
jgi:rhodanese-related sulfurtransferase